LAGLSARLKTIAGYIKKGQAMADIGADHGFLPLYLWENGISPKVIMTDSSEKSLSKAMAAFDKYTGDPGVCFRVSDGLKGIKEREVDVIVIAGMGGVLITNILGADTGKTLSFERYILQPRNGSGKLRFWLRNAGFTIVAENLAPEGKFISEIIVAAPPFGFTALPSLKDYQDEIKYEIPGIQNVDKELFAKYLKNKLNIEKSIMGEMKAGKAGNVKKLNETKKRIQFIEEIMEEATSNDAH